MDRYLNSLKKAKCSSCGVSFTYQTPAYFDPPPLCCQCNWAAMRRDMAQAEMKRRD